MKRCCKLAEKRKRSVMQTEYSGSPELRNYVEKLRLYMLRYEYFERSVEPWAKWMGRYAAELNELYDKLSQEDKEEIGAKPQTLKDPRDQVMLYEKLLNEYRYTIQNKWYDGFSNNVPPIWEQYAHLVVVHNNLSEADREKHPLPTGEAKDPRSARTFFLKRKKYYDYLQKDFACDGYWDKKKMRFVYQQMAWLHSNLPAEQQLLWKLPEGEGKDPRGPLHVYQQRVERYNRDHAAVAARKEEWCYTMRERYQKLLKRRAKLSEEDQKYAPVPDGNGTDPTPPPTPLEAYTEAEKQYNGWVKDKIKYGDGWGDMPKHYERLVGLHDALSDDEKQARPLPSDRGQDPRTALEKYRGAVLQASQAIGLLREDASASARCMGEAYTDRVKKAYDALSEEDKKIVDKEKLLERIRAAKEQREAQDRMMKESDERIQRLMEQEKRDAADWAQKIIKTTKEATRDEPCDETRDVTRDETRVGDV